jgi:hypothetical protein
MDAPLTGADAREALGVYMGLGNAGARFDARRVARLVTSAAGRRSIMTALRAAVRTVTVQSRSRLPVRAAVSRRRVRAATASPGEPARPAALSTSRAGF